MLSCRKFITITKAKEYTVLLYQEDWIYCLWNPFDLAQRLILTVYCRTVGFVIGFSTFLLGCIDYSRLRHEKATQLSRVVVDHCVSRYICIHLDTNNTNQGFQIFGIYPSVFYFVYSLLHVADCFVRVRGYAIGGYVQLLHTSPEDSRCQSPSKYGPRFLTALMIRPTSKQFHGRKSSDGLVQFGKRIQLLPFPQKVHATRMIPLQPN